MKCWLFILMALICLETNGQMISLNLDDSIAVREFISKHSLCEQILAAEVYKMPIVKEKGYGLLLLQSISTTADFKFLIPIASIAGIVSDESKLRELQEQLDEIKQTFNCQKNIPDSNNTKGF